MDAGRLNKRITLERLIQEQDPIYGAPLDTWVPTYSVWAAIEPVSGREYWQAKLALAEKTIRIRMRYLPGIDSSMRVAYSGRIFSIQSVINVDEANREIQLMCLEHSV